MIVEIRYQKFRKHYSGPQQDRLLCRVPGNSLSPSSWQLGSVSDILLGYFYVASNDNNSDDNNNVFSYFCGRPHPSTSHRWSLWLTHLIFSHIKLVWNVLLEIMVRALWGILEQPMRPPGTGQTEGTKSERRIQRKCVFRRREVCIHLIICVFSAFCEGTRWGPFTPQWVFRLPAVIACYLLSPFLLTSLPLFSPFTFSFAIGFISISGLQ